MYSLPIISTAILALAGPGLACNLVKSVKLTNYGYPDANGIPSYRCQNGQPVQPGTSTKLGDGSFNNPYAAAAAVTSNTFKKCQKVYVPILKKFFIIQDDCSACHATPDSWIDLYLVQSNKNIGQTNCEKAFGTLSYTSNPNPYQHSVLVNPQSGYLTNTQPLFQNGVCYNQVSQNRVFPSCDAVAKCATNQNQKQLDPIVPTVSDTDPSFLNTPLLDTDPADRNATSTDPAISKVVPEAPGEIPDGTPAASVEARLRFARGRSGYNGVPGDGTGEE
ncbi:hypothetical protein ACLMJK_008482 [Lecanora helva]